MSRFTPACAMRVCCYPRRRCLRLPYVQRLLPFARCGALIIDAAYLHMFTRTPPRAEMLPAQRAVPRQRYGIAYAAHAARYFRRCAMPRFTRPLTPCYAMRAYDDVTRVAICFFFASIIC